jgi:2-polyprenyl-3-methyl-5-hydroxy-6-metoxy-1,4-benzoquinol methylase
MLGLIKEGKVMKDACRICGSNFGHFILKKQRGTYESKWALCSNCESAHIDPYPTIDELNEYYNSSYLEMDLTGADGGVNHKSRFSEEYKPTVFTEYGWSLKDAGLHINDMRLKDTKVLDFGCANGIFLDYLLLQGIEKEKLYGYDVGEDMIFEAIGKGLNCTADIRAIDKLSFDFITLWDVIEHVPYPKDVAKWVVSKLNPGGGVFIQTPHFGDLAMNLNSTFSHYLVIEHLHLFSRKALIKLFEDEGMVCQSQSSFGANAFSKSVGEPYKSTYDKLAKKYDFGATQVLFFKLRD